MIYEEKLFILECSSTSISGWNGKDLNGYTLSQGIYIYKLHVRNKSNNRTEIIHSKLLKLR